MMHEVKRGFTLMETLIVIGIISVLVALIGFSMLDARSKSALDDATSLTVRTIETARNKSVSAVSGEQYGVRINSTEIELFTGSTYSSSAVYFTGYYPAFVTSDQTDTDIVFSKISGTTSGDFTIELEHSKTGNTETISILQNGKISN